MINYYYAFDYIYLNPKLYWMRVVVMIKLNN